LYITAVVFATTPRQELLGAKVRVAPGAVAYFSACGIMNSTSPVDRYRKQAERVRQLANTAASDGTRAELLSIARQYEDLADAAERNSANFDE